MRKKLNLEKIIRGTLWALVINFSLLFLLAYLLKSDSIKAEQTEAALIIINVMAGLACAVFSRGRGGGRSLANVLLSALLFAVFVTLPFALRGDLSLNTLRVFAITIASAVLGNMLPLVKSNKRFRKRSKF